MVKPWDKSRLVLEIADRIRPLLAGNDPEVQGAILAELTTSWILGHHPAIRGDMLTVHYKAVIHMAAEYLRSGGEPWAEQIKKEEAEAEAKGATKQ